MPTKLSKLLTLALTIFVTFFAGSGRSETRAAAQENSSNCSRIALLVPRLRSRSDAMRARAKKAILRTSRRSESSRQCAIQKMLDIAALPTTRSDKARPLFWETPGLYLQWIEAVGILGEMRATEAIDTLIACLDCNDGPSSLGLGHFPAALSLIKFSDQAIPKLEAVLRQKPVRNRSQAALTLAEIGGEKAKLILLETLKTETDKSVTDVIENILLGWNASRSSQR
jgi:hypothetical protein